MGTSPPRATPHIGRLDQSAPRGLGPAVEGDPRSALPHRITGGGRALAPVFVGARGAWLWDEGDRRYLDLHGGYGTAILGYSDPEVDGAVADAMAAGRTFVGTANRYEGELAARLVSLLPEAERVALCGGGGSDGLYHATRLARAATGRQLVAKVEGGYHGWHAQLGASTSPEPDRLGDALLPDAIPNSAGILPAVTEAVRVVSVNDEASLRARFDRDGDDLAALVVEPVLYSAGTVEVDVSWLALARELCDRHGALLIFDEVVSGFRERLGGVGTAMGVVPDLAVYGKAIANGHVLAAIAGRADVLDLLAPGGPVFFLGTFNASPLGCIAASATLDVLARGEAHPRAVGSAARLAEHVNAGIARLGVRAVCQQHGSGFTLYLGTRAVRSYRDLAEITRPDVLALNDELRAHLLRDGIFMQYRRATNRCYVSAAHEAEHVDHAAASMVAFLESVTDAPALAG